MRVIIVDGAQISRESLSEALQADGIEVVATAPDAPTALEAVEEYRPDVALVELRLPGQDGDHLAVQLLDNHMVDYVVIMSVDGSSTARQRASRAGAALFVDKCHDTASLGRKLRQLETSIPAQQLPLLEAVTSSTI